MPPFLSVSTFLPLRLQIAYLTESRLNKKQEKCCKFNVSPAFQTTAADRNRTGTGITTHGILSPGRLPVPPLRQEMLIRFLRKAYALCTVFSTSHQWAEVDSNHRSKLQQIYSLSPLATRESTHFVSRQYLFIS